MKTQSIYNKKGRVTGENVPYINVPELSTSEIKEVIVSTVEGEFDLKREVIRSRRRTRELVFARDCIAYNLRRYTMKSFREAATKQRFITM